MAEKANKTRRTVKKTESLRQKAEKAATAEPKPRRVHRAASGASRPFRAIGKLIAKVFKPLAFMLKPFKTRPALFVGRILAKVLLLRFFREAWKEVRQVQWLNMRDTFRLSFAVFAFAIVFGIVIAVTDYGLDKVFKKLLLNN